VLAITPQPSKLVRLRGIEWNHHFNIFNTLKVIGSQLAAA